MSGIITITGIGIVAAILVYMLFKLNEREDRDEEGGKHFLFQILVLVFILICLLLIAKSVLDETNYCEVMPVNATISGSLTQYDYQRLCFTNEANTSLTFYKAMTYFIIIISFYVFVYVFISVKDYVIEFFTKRNR